MVLLVAVGFAVGALYYSWKEPRVRAQIQVELDAAPTTAEGRLEHWLAHGEPQVHHNLAVFARVSADLPWIVTHTVAASDGGAPYVHGIDVGALPRDLLSREGTTVVLHLARPRGLGRASLGGDSTAHIPHYASDVAQEVADARLREVVAYLLDDLIAALEKDIEGARFEIRLDS
jgi:hypothetical protein